MSRALNSAKVGIRMILVGEQVGATSFDYSAFPVASSCSLFGDVMLHQVRLQLPFPL